MSNYPPSIVMTVTMKMMTTSTTVSKAGKMPSASSVTRTRTMVPPPVMMSTTRPRSGGPRTTTSLKKSRNLTTVLLPSPRLAEPPCRQPMRLAPALKTPEAEHQSPPALHLPPAARLIPNTAHPSTDAPFVWRLRRTLALRAVDMSSVLRKLLPSGVKTWTCG